MDENDVNITKNRRLLKAIREERERTADVSTQSGSGVSSGYAPGSDGSDRQDAGGAKQSNPRTERREERTSQTERTTPGVREGVRQADRSTQYQQQSTFTSDRRSEKEPVSFRLKGLWGRKQQEPVKLFSKVEAEAEFEKIYDVYFYGSGLLDDILEICVKDHEPVQIWQLEPDEAKTLATMHLQRATYDKKAAASARQLIALYDRLYFWILAGPRCKATYTYVKIHGGFSFR
jgi:hypothetical protein